MGAPSTDQLVAAEDEVLVAPPMVPVSPELQALANSCGVATEYFDQSKELRQISAVTVQAVLSAFGVDASTPTSCLTALEERRLAHWRRMLPPVFVTPQSAHAVTWVHVRDGDPVGMWIELEDGGIRHDLLQVENNSPAEEVDGRLVGEASFQLPRDLPLGWHQLKAESRGKRASVPLVVAPDRLELPKSLQNRHGWGFAVQLYSLRSRRSWGIGDLSDLSDLAAWSGHQLGADFVQINPVHASEPTAPMAPSPYLPVTRRFANPLYVRVEDVAEFAYLGDDDRALIRRIGAEAATHNDTADLLDRDSCWQAKREALEIVARIERSPGRQAEYDAFRKAEGDGLRDFATWCALVERYGQDFEDWPWELQDPASPAVKIERQRLADRVEFFCWLQWITDTQLAHCPGGGEIVRDAVGDPARPRGGGAPAWRGRLGAAGRSGARSHGRSAAGYVQPDGSELVTATLAAGLAGRPRLPALPRHVAHRAAQRRRTATRPRVGSLSALVGAGGDAGLRGNLRQIRP